MPQKDALRVFGVYISTPVYDALEEHLETTVGVVDVDSYFDRQQSSVPRGDPAAEVTNILVEMVVDEFSNLYDTADFDAARRVNSDDFRLFHLAARPLLVTETKELFRSAATIQGTDSRTVHTAIINAALNRELPTISPKRAASLGLEVPDK